LTRFEDLPKAKRLVVGTPEVPIGSYTVEILQKAAARLGADFAKQVEANVASRELNVRQILAKVALALLAMGAGGILALRRWRAAQGQS